jgi:agmatine deiminase
MAAIGVGLGGPFGGPLNGPGGPPAEAAAPALTVPPEDAPHAGTLMQWPASAHVHPEPAVRAALQATIAEIASVLAAFEPVYLLADRDAHAAIRRQVSAAVTLWDIPTEDLWARDSGPLFALDPKGRLAVSHLRFNGWGGRQIHRHDGKVAAAVADRLGVPVVDSGLVGEAGGVDHDGQDLLIAHESSWVTESRNPGLDRAEVGRRLCAAYGAERIVWAPGLYGEDITDYHIDSLARFIAPGRILIQVPRGPARADPFARAALKTRQTLSDAGLALTEIADPDPRRIRSRAPDFVASYANFYVCNGAVLTAQFGDRAADAAASAALAEAFPGREVIALDIDPLGEAGGGIHCATQQIPAV